MTAKELLDLINTRTTCVIEFSRPEQDTFNFNEYGQLNRLNPINRGREKYTVTLDQDALEQLAASVDRK